MSSSLGTVLVTGAAKRLGGAFALYLGKRGYAVAVHYGGSADEAGAVAHAIESDGGRAETFQADLFDVGAVARLMPAVADRLGPVTCLINNASLFVYDDIATLEAGRWDAHQAVNLRAPVLLSQALMRQLPEAAAGNIINIIDQRVWKPTPHFLSYAASKAGLWALTQTLAQGLAPRIRVNGIGPGPLLQSIHQKAADFAAQSRAVPLQRGTTPAEICAAVDFILASPALTGQMIALDGGQHLAWATPDIGDGRG
jgi:NAD(P)-dependent dehydrogenase (short-subunit alcohol dehydrogenase family)